MTQQKIYKVGIYARLSKENARDEESLSIENQKLILTKHVRDNGWELIDIYYDDGFSGANQDRPALQKMLQDVKEGYINTILIKDRPNESNASKWVSLIKGYAQLEALDTQTLIRIVERIVVSDVPTGAGKTSRYVNIIYKHVGDLSWLNLGNI